MADYKISEESAQEQFQIFLDYYDLDEDDFDDSDVKAGMSLSRKKLTRAIRKGMLEISNDKKLVVTQHLKAPKGENSVINYRIVNGTSKISMKSKSSKDTYGKIYALLGSLSDLGDMAIQKLEGADLGVAESLGTLFLQV